MHLRAIDNKSEGRLCMFWMCVCVCVIIGRVQVAGSSKQQEQSHFLWCWEQLATPATESLVLAHTEVRPAEDGGWFWNKGRKVG